MRWMPTLTLCIGLALLSGFVLFSAGPSHTSPWLNGLFLVSAAGVVALGVRLFVRALRRQADEAIEEAEHPAPLGQRHPPPHQ